MKKKVITSITCVLAVVMVTCLVMTSILLRSQQQVDANVAFNGIDSIIAANSVDNKYKIVELVPDTAMAEFGYLIKGQEPKQWKITLQGMNNRANRIAYMDELAQLLSGISSKDNVKPLKYTKYSEEYAVENSEGWNKLLLSNEEILQKGTSGYTMQEMTGGDYDYSYSYSLNVDGTGKYNQNVDYYVPQNGSYYSVIFEAVNNDDIFVESENDKGEIVSVVRDKVSLYQVSDSIAITSQTDLDNLKAQYPKESNVYRLSLDNIAGSYEFYEKLDNVNTYDQLESLDEFMYFCVQFKHVPSKNAVYGENYYEVVSSEFMPDMSGEYGAVLDENNPYKEVQENQKGYFDREDDDCYLFVGEGKGTHTLKKDKGKKLDYDVHIRQVYYKGGFKNNEWFVNGVFNQNSSLDKEIYCEVTTVSPKWSGDAKGTMYTNCDLVYISSSSVINGNIASFSEENDITWDDVCTLVSEVKSSDNLPVILDYSILKDVKINKYMTNIQKLAAILCCNMLQSIEFSEKVEDDEAFWKTISENQIKDNDGHFVNSCVYVYPGNENSQDGNNVPYLFDAMNASFIDVNSNDKFLEKAKESGFEEIAQNIIDENLNRKTENEANKDDEFEYFDLRISKAIAIEYIIGYSSKQEKKNDKSISVLDIEPCYVNNSTKGAIDEATIASWFGTKYKVEIGSVTHMSTAEFIGKIEDLSKYDLIYFGLNTNKMNVKNGVTQYNDSDMNGLIYSNIGDIAVAQVNHAGLLDTDYNYDGLSRRNSIISNFKDAEIKNVSVSKYQQANNTYRYSGNDITKERMNAIRKYVKAGFPVVVEDDFFVNNSGTLSMNSKYIDNCSYIYELMEDIINYDNVSSVSQVKGNAKQIFNYLELGHPVISAMDESTVSKDEYVTVSNHTFSEVFTISNPGSANAKATFDCTLYLDSNSDGKFSTTQEGIGANDVKIYHNGTLIKPVYDLDEDRYYYELESGSTHTYKLVYTLPDSYVGLIPWKMIISQNDNVYRTDSMQGYMYLPNEGNKEVIKILQITQSSKPKSSSAPSNFNMQKQYEDKNSKFYELINNLEDFELVIETVNSDVFNKNYVAKYKSRIETDENSTPYYDMLVMGFSDMYEILDTGTGCVDGIKEYINMGYPVLFTHDTTSFNNDSTDTSKWGYDFNSKIRNLVGMDRYGILSSNVLSKGLQLEKNSNATGYLYDAAVEESLEKGTDIAYKPGSNKQIIVKQSQGYSIADLAQYAVRAGSQYNKYYYLSGITAKTLTKTTSVEQVNTGQITIYPYKLGKTLDVASTHSQYYQLDMNEDADNDGESDIVVWYTLKGSSQALGASPKDVRNNYYIYTKGNVTYSGVGHSGGLTEDELKLYINTMIAAYSSARRAPTISLMESDKDDAAKINTIYVSYDDILKNKDDSLEKSGEVEKGTTSIEDELANEKGKTAKQDVYFSIVDTNLVTNLNSKYEVVEFGIPVSESEYKKGSKSEYMMVSDGSGNVIYLKKIELDVYRGDNKHRFNLLSSSVTYRVEIPLSLMHASEDYCDIYVVAYTKIVRNSSDGTDKIYTTKTPSAYERMRLQKIGLTDLD